MADPAPSVYNRYSENNDAIALFSRTSTVRRCQHTDWDLCESVRLQELQEARERAAQMEKTMRWWSECTAAWRAKWSLVRDERNRAREEGQSLRHAVFSANAKLDTLQQEKREVEMELMKAKTALHKLSVHHLQTNKSVDVNDVSIDRLDASTEIIPETFTVSVQTDDTPNVDSFDIMTSSTRSLLSPFTSKERSVLEDKCSDLQAELCDAKCMVEELEACREAMKDEICELRRESTARQSENEKDEVIKIKEQLSAALREVERLKKEQRPEERVVGYKNGQYAKSQTDIPTVTVTSDIDLDDVDDGPHSD